jgi:hypothetical protein
MLKDVFLLKINVEVLLRSIITRDFQDLSGLGINSGDSVF